MRTANNLERSECFECVVAWQRPNRRFPFKILPIQTPFPRRHLPVPVGKLNRFYTPAQNSMQELFPNPLKVLFRRLELSGKIRFRDVIGNDCHGLSARTTTTKTKGPQILAGFRAPRLPTIGRHDPPIHVRSLVVVGISSHQPICIWICGPRIPFVRFGPVTRKSQPTPAGGPFLRGFLFRRRASHKLCQSPCAAVSAALIRAWTFVCPNAD